MEEQDLALKIVPHALPRLTKGEDEGGLQALAAKAGLDVAAMMTQHSLRLLAQCIYEGGAFAAAVSCQLWSGAQLAS